MKPQKTRQKNSVRNWVFEQQTRPKNCKFSQILQAKTKKKQTLVFGFVWQDLSEEQESSEF